jgi:hypothetical protein
MTDNEPNAPAGGVAGTAAPGPIAAQDAPRTYSPKTEGRKQKLATQPHGYIADKVVTILRAIRQLGRGSRKSRGSDTTAATRPGEAAGKDFTRK